MGHYQQMSIGLILCMGRWRGVAVERWTGIPVGSRGRQLENHLWFRVLDWYMMWLIIIQRTKGARHIRLELKLFGIRKSKKKCIKSIICQEIKSKILTSITSKLNLEVLILKKGWLFVNK